MAANTSTFDLRGDKELIRALARLEDKVERRVLTSAVGKAARPILQSAKAKAPQDTGSLRNSLGIKRYRSRRLPMAVAIIGPRTNFKQTKQVAGRVGKKNIKPHKYAHLVEFGTKPHAIVAKGPYLLRIGRIILGKYVSHPGTPPRPFLGPAYLENVNKAQKIMASEIWKGIRKEAARGR